MLRFSFVLLATSGATTDQGADSALGLILERWGIGGAGLLIAIWALFNPEKAAMVAAWIGRVFSLFQWGRRVAVAKGIEATLGLAARGFEDVSDELLPRTVRVKWVHGDQGREAFLEEDQVVVFMQHHANQSKNVAVAAMEFVSNGLLPKGRLYLDSSLKQSSELSMVRHLLRKSDRQALTFFLNEVMGPTREEDPELKRLIDDLCHMDDEGLLVQIFLREVAEMAAVVFPAPPEDRIQREIRGFCNYLIAVARRKQGEELSSLTYRRNRFAVGLVLVANPWTYSRRGAKPYIHGFRMRVKEGARNVYLCAYERNEGAVRAVAKELEKDPKVARVELMPYTNDHRSGGIIARIETAQPIREAVPRGGDVQSAS